MVPVSTRSLNGTSTHITDQTASPALVLDGNRYDLPSADPSATAAAPNTLQRGRVVDYDMRDLLDMSPRHAGWLIKGLVATVGRLRPDALHHRFARLVTFVPSKGMQDSTWDCVCINVAALSATCDVKVGVCAGDSPSDQGNRHERVGGRNHSVQVVRSGGCSEGRSVPDRDLRIVLEQITRHRAGQTPTSHDESAKTATQSNSKKTSS